MIYGEKNDREFEREILAALQGVPYARHNYRYAVKEGDQGLSSLLANGKDNLLIVLSDSGLEVDRILAAIASANTNLVARGKTPPRFTIVAIRVGTASGTSIGRSTSRTGSCSSRLITPNAMPR